MADQVFLAPGIKYYPTIQSATFQPAAASAPIAAYADNTGTLPGATLTVDFEDQDAGFATSSAGIITIDSAGKYTVCGVVAIDPAAAADAAVEVNAALSLNNTTTLAQSHLRYKAGTNVQDIAIPLQWAGFLQVGDNLRLLVENLSPGTVVVDAGPATAFDILFKK